MLFFYFGGKETSTTDIEPPKDLARLRSIGPTRLNQCPLEGVRSLGISRANFIQRGSPLAWWFSQGNVFQNPLHAGLGTI